MMDQAVINQWSNGLFQLASESNKITKFVKESSILIDIFATYPLFIAIVSSNNLSKEVEKSIIITTFKNNIEPYLLNLFLLLIDGRHFYYIVAILKQFCKLCNQYRDINYGIIYSVVKLTTVQIKQIQTKIEKIINHKIKLVNKIDPSLIGGIKVKVQNQVFDGSIKGQIEQLKQELLNHE